MLYDHHLTHLWLYSLYECDRLVVDRIHPIAGREGGIKVEVAFGLGAFDQPINRRKLLKAIPKKEMGMVRVDRFGVALKRVKGDWVVLHKVGIRCPPTKCLKPDRARACKDLDKGLPHNLKLQSVKKRLLEDTLGATGCGDVGDLYLFTLMGTCGDCGRKELDPLLFSAMSLLGAVVGVSSVSHTAIVPQSIKIYNSSKGMDQLCPLFDIGSLFSWLCTRDDRTPCNEFGAIIFADPPIGMHNDRLSLILP